MNAGRLVLLFVVGLTVLALTAWMTLPLVGVAGVAFTQVPVLDHILTQMGIDSRIRAALSYLLWTAVFLCAHHCLRRRKHAFSRFSLVSVVAVALAYVAWYANDRWLAGTKPLDMGDPALQAQAFDPYTGSPNLTATTGTGDEVRVFWKNVKVDPVSGAPTHPMESQEFLKLLEKKLQKDKLRGEERSEQEEKSRLAQAELAQRAQEVTELQNKNMNLQQEIRGTETKNAFLQETLNSVAGKDQQLKDLQARMQAVQQALHDQRALHSSMEQTPPPTTVPVVAPLQQPPVASQGINTFAETIPDSHPVSSPVANSCPLRQGQWRKVRLDSSFTYFWSNGPFEFGVPPLAPKPAWHGRICVTGTPGAIAKIRPLSPEATMIWCQNASQLSP